MPNLTQFPIGVEPTRPDPPIADPWDQISTLDLVEALHRLMDRYGTGRVVSSAKFVAGIRGEKTS